MSFFKFTPPFFLLLSLFVYDARAEVARKSLSQYWHDVGLSFSLVEKRVNRESCDSDSRHFLGCVEAINAVLATNEPPLALTPELSHVSRHDFGVVKAVESNELPLAKSDSDRIQKAWLSLFHEGGRKVDFAAISRWVKETLFTPDRESEMTATALDGYLGATEDPHTRLLPARYLQDREGAGARQFSGIGVSLGTAGHAGIVIQRVLENSPAQTAGLAANDVLVQIDGEKVRRGPSLEEATRKIEGPEGSQVVLTVRRGKQTSEFRLTRAKMLTQNVTVGLIGSSARKWGYLRIGNFVDGHPCDETRRGIAAVTAAGARGLILDLRDNSGGYLAEAVCVAGLFLGPDKIVVTLRRLAPPQEEQVRRTPASVVAFTALPVVTLANAHSASAAEIVAGALQDYGRSLIIGTRTYGKGSVQDVVPWNEAVGVDYVFTVARYYTPLGRSIQLAGVSPDIPAPRDPHSPGAELFSSREEDYANALPAQSRGSLPNPLSASLQACVRKGTALERYDAARASSTTPDYPRWLAEDTLGCAH